MELKIFFFEKLNKVKVKVQLGNMVAVVPKTEYHLIGECKVLEFFENPNKMVIFIDTTDYLLATKKYEFNFEPIKDYYIDEYYGGVK